MADKGVYGFFCPHCNREIAYNMSYYNNKIAELKADISNIDLEFARQKGNEQVDKDWKRRAQSAKSIKIKQLAELKAYRTTANEYLNHNIEHTMCQLVKDKYGEEVYKQLIEEAEKLCEHTTAIAAMKVAYTRADGKKIVKV